MVLSSIFIKISFVCQIDVQESPGSNRNNIGWKNSYINKSSDTFPYDAIVRFSYIPQENDELSLTPGDIVRVLDKGEDNGWLFGSINGTKGVFPDSYIERISDTPENIDKKRTPSESGSTTSSHLNNTSIESELDIALVAFDYVASRDDELTLKKGDRILIIERNNVEEGWFKGKHLTTNKIGVFPANFTKYREIPIPETPVHRKPPMPAPNSSISSVIPPALPQKPKSVSTLVTQLNSSSSITSSPTSSLSSIAAQQNMTIPSNISSNATMTTQDNSNAALNNTNGCMNNSSNVSRCLSPSKDINNQNLNADCTQSRNNNNKSPDNISNNMSHTPGNNKMNRISSPLDGVSVADRRNLIGSKLKFDPMNTGRFSLGGGMMTSLNTSLGHDQSNDNNLPSPGGSKNPESLSEGGGLFDNKPTAKLLGPTVNRIKPVGKRPPSAMFIKNRYTAIEETNTPEIEKKFDRSVSHLSTNVLSPTIGSNVDDKVILRNKSPTLPSYSNEGYVTRKEYDEKVNQLTSEIESLKSRIKDLELRK
ncbi:BcDNA.GH03163 [Strongyloides ratti]|uniref:BcDNA.GH03163 n=1 Tax=Strongyloides ratti TaxID=34506 RepID=A0A090LHG4_STRRB|nr:BcDNA.GH03163 [Strongyloides ratti]CEF66950.2 BcDNA.GH03163 [Strongyloides ratti]